MTISNAPSQLKMQNGVIGLLVSALSTILQMINALLRHRVSVALTTNVVLVLIKRLGLVKVANVLIKPETWNFTRKNMNATLLNVAK